MASAPAVYCHRRRCRPVSELAPEFAIHMSPSACTATGWRTCNWLARLRRLVHIFSIFQRMRTSRSSQTCCASNASICDSRELRMIRLPPLVAARPLDKNWTSRLRPGGVGSHCDREDRKVVDSLRHVSRLDYVLAYFCRLIGDRAVVRQIFNSLISTWTPSGRVSVASFANKPRRLRRVQRCNGASKLCSASLSDSRSFRKGLQLLYAI